MKKLILTILLLIFVGYTTGQASEIVGNYANNPKITPGIKDDGTEKRKKIIERFRWTMSISEDSLSITTGSDRKPMTFPYKIVGRFILCESIDDDKTIYLPFYINDDGTIHGSMQIFFKVE